MSGRSLFNLKNIFPQLTCHHCRDLLLGPTAVCENGHSFCSSCKPAAEECPACLGRMLPGVRNQPIENVVSLVRNKCPNYRAGCRTLLSAELYPRHLATCRHNVTSCPLSQVPRSRCTWEGPSSELLNHVRNFHAENLTLKNYFSCPSIVDAYSLTIYEDELFLYYKRIVRNIWYASVMSCGLTAKIFKSVMTFDSPEKPSEERLVITFSVNNIYEGVGHILVMGRCTVLDDALVRHYIKNDVLNMFVSIEKVGELQLV